MCPRCHNNAVGVITHKRFFSLFFVPLIPLKWGKRCKCFICGYTAEVNKDTLTRVKQGAPLVLS
ncbi:uncharacterized protein ASCRUDRAFT_29528 [Ascoidea rubescens DSM 1968]|uniref:Uncharacterized protein n=1 Tax=Ascoidea rubescens DSM 1968 TaxID=1344418 RepID=A0A1D2VRZ3_9ASCO|nr:hypothetical protein ASCRUDRAFT_29528 [Ascoidea rubescens DSM 1968]ODV64376.1 hypothetical protein ASCRUDRAFT_29528 [Ascoidea rubescens DSM 1968]